MRGACYVERRRRGPGTSTASLHNARPMARLTGERPMAGATPDSLLAFHDAGYREMAERLGPGTVLDVGCGVGDQTARLGRPRSPRRSASTTAPQTAIDAAHEWGHAGLRFAAMDGARIGARDRVRSTGCARRTSSSTSCAPEQHVAELARVATDDGTALVITPNRPADFENPFHVSLFEAAELESLLALFFHDVTVQGLEGSPELHADFAQRRASGEKLLRLDPLEPAPQGAAQLVRVELRARAARGLPGARLGAHRHRLGPRRVALLPHRPDRADHARAVRGGAPTAPLTRRLLRPEPPRVGAVGVGRRVGVAALGDLLELRGQPLVDHGRRRPAVKCTPSPRIT